MVDELSVRDPAGGAAGRMARDGKARTNSYRLS
jgi:hypothetical protein